MDRSRPWCPACSRLCRVVACALCMVAMPVAAQETPSHRLTLTRRGPPRSPTPRRFVSPRSPRSSSCAALPTASSSASSTSIPGIAGHRATSTTHRAGSRASPPTLDILEGRLAGVRYDPATAVLTYDGSGTGSETAVVQLDAPVAGGRVRAVSHSRAAADDRLGRRRRDAVPRHRSRLRAGALERHAAMMLRTAHRCRSQRAVRHRRNVTRPTSSSVVARATSTCSAIRSRARSSLATASISTTSRPPTSGTSSSSTR